MGEQGRSRPTASASPTCRSATAFRAYIAWKRYRGGQTTPIWIADLSDSSVEKVPRENSNDFYPMWVGDGKVYFLSDRDGPTTLFAYDTATKAVRQLVENERATTSSPPPPARTPSSTSSSARCTCST